LNWLGGADANPQYGFKACAQASADVGGTTTVLRYEGL